MSKKNLSRITTILISTILVFSVLASVTPAALASTTSTTATNWHASTMVQLERPFATASPYGYSPSQIRTAYGLPSSGGSGVIAIIDAYADPTVVNDLNTFDTVYGLPAANIIVHPMSSSIATDSDWALETSLDVEWAHALAPSATILLVEASSDGLIDLLDAVNYATSQPSVVAVSMSWGGSEFNSESFYDSYFTSQQGTVFFASAGDNGAGTMWPCASPNVVGVGGTTLNFANGVVSSETAWSGSGGGVSAYEAEPSYQLAYGVTGTNGYRACPDVSFDGNPNTGVAIYDSTPYSGSSGWWMVGGTSVGAPCWAAIQSLGLSISNSNLYQDAKSSSYSSYLRDITSGSNGNSAGVGYDLVTGLGSPVTTNFAPPTSQDFSISLSPSNSTIYPSNSTNSTISISSINSFSGTVTLQASASSSIGASFTLQSLSIPAGGSNSSILVITTQPDTPAGSYVVTVEVADGSLVHTTSFTVNVQNAPTVPSAPQSLSAKASTSNITLSWLAPASNGGSNITLYTVYRGTASGKETPLANVTSLTYTDTAVVSGQTYYYEVTATNSIGSSAPSNEVNATDSLPAPTVPSAPQSLSAKASTSNITLSWLAPASNGGSNITEYKVYRSTSSGTETFLAISITTNYTDPSAQKGISYYYKVTAVNAIGESNSSNEANARILTTSSNTLVVSITTAKPSYPIGSSVTITLTVKDSNGNPIRGAMLFIGVTCVGSGGWYMLTTNSSGMATLNFSTNTQKAETYTITVNAVCSGYSTGTGKLTFST